MTRKTHLKVAGRELEFASLNFKEMAAQVAQSQECESRGYHVAVEPSQAKVQRVGDKDLAVNLCQECGIWTLAERFGFTAGGDATSTTVRH